MNVWTKKQDDILIHSKTKTFDELSKLTVHPKNSVKNRCVKLRKRGYIINPIGSNLLWTDREIEILKLNSKTMNRMELTKILQGRSWRSICNQTWNLNLRPKLTDKKGKNSP